MKYNIVVIALLILAFSSCEKVIKVKINSSASQYVIVGNVNDQPGPYTVNITKSVDFQVDNNFPAVSGATVAITDQTAGITDTMAEATPGNYITTTIVGQSGHTYLLYVNIAGQVFTAASTMPAAVPMDSLYQEASTFGNGFSIVPVYTDPAGVSNFYHLVQYVNNVESKVVLVRSDVITDGLTINEPIDLANDTTIHVGDNVTVDLQSIDSFVYTYYRNLNQTIEQNAAAPANPATNIVGATLGYFSAHTTRAKTITIHP